MVANISTTNVKKLQKCSANYSKLWLNVSDTAVIPEVFFDAIWYNKSKYL